MSQDRSRTLEEKQSDKNHFLNKSIVPPNFGGGISASMSHDTRLSISNSQPNLTKDQTNRSKHLLHNPSLLKDIRIDSRGQMDGRLMKHERSEQSKRIIASSTLSLSEFDEASMRTWLLQQTQLNPNDLNIEKQRGEVIVQLWGLEEDRENAQLIASFNSYFQYKKYVFCSEDDASVVKREVELIKQRTPSMDIRYIEGFGPYSFEQLQKPDNNRSQSRRIQKNDTTFNPANIHMFRCFRYQGTPTVYAKVIEQVKRAVKHQQQKAKEEMWTFEIAPCAVEFLMKEHVVVELQKKLQKQAERHKCCKTIDQMMWKPDGLQCRFVPAEGGSRSETNQLRKSLRDIFLRNLQVVEIPFQLDACQGLSEQFIISQSKGKAYLVTFEGAVEMQRLKAAIQTIAVSLSMKISKETCSMLGNYTKQLEQKHLKRLAIVERTEEQNVTLTFEGPVRVVNIAMSEMWEQIEKRDASQWSFQIPVSKQDCEIVKSYDILSAIEKEFRVATKLMSQQQKELRVCIRKGRSLVLVRRHYSLVEGSPLVVVLNEADMYHFSSDNKYPAVLNEPYQMDSQERVCLLRDLRNLGKMLRQTEMGWRVVLVPPEDISLKSMYQEVLKVLSQLVSDEQISIYFCSRNMEASSEHEELIEWVQGELKISDGVTAQWKEMIGGQEVAYCASAAKKIERAFQQGQTTVNLDEEDLGITDPTHQYHLNIQSLENLHTFSVDKLTKLRNMWLLGGVELTPNQIANIKAAQDLECLTLVTHSIDLRRMKQTNLFTKSESQVVRKDLKTFKLGPFKDFEGSIAQVILQVLHVKCDRTHGQDLQQKVALRLRKCLNERTKISDVLDLGSKNISIQKLRIVCFQNNVSLLGIRPKGSSFIVDLKGHSINDINKVKNHQQAKVLAENIEPVSRKISVPKHWTNSHEDIVLYEVDKNSEEFAREQILFKFTMIKRLQRVENKLIWRKYMQEKEHLEYITGEPIRQMDLYHGTRQHNPRGIYEDKEEAFNINYSSEHNYFGRGIYFAQEASYSNKYAFHSSNKRKIILGCRVLIGLSQEMGDKDRSNQIRDTRVRDEAMNIKFESIHSRYDGSDVYVIYKSSRAYPQYVIEY